MAKSSDIISIAVGETWRHAGMVAKASGSAITAGTVNYYLKAKSGANVGKWWNNGDQTWAASETANAMSHDADGNWTIELAASPFTDGVLYLEYAKESGDLHVAGEGKLLRGQANPFNGITSLADWLGALAGKTADAATRAEINATTAGAGYNETTDSLEAIRDRGDAAWRTAGSGTGGDYTQTVTVTAGGVAVQNATVYIMDGTTIIDKQTTNASGVATPSADAGTYTLKTVKSGYTTNSAEITVTEAAARAVTMTALSFTPPTDEDQVTGWGYVYDESGAAESGATVYIEQVTAGARNIYDSKRRTLTADATGLVSGNVWADGSEYRISRDGVNWSDPFAPEDDGDVALPDSYRLPGLVGTS